MDKPTQHIEQNVPLAPFTTIGLGGRARYFSRCTSVEEVRESLRMAREHNLPVQILGGGSNVIFADSGFDGLVVNVVIPGVRMVDDGEHELVTASAGEQWDRVVQISVERGLSGIECLSGIPGFTGATPVQNVGAYGQEVKETILSLTAIDTGTLEAITFANHDCRFAYRMSRFKAEDEGRFIITAVTFRLKKNGSPPIRYRELQTFLENTPAVPQNAKGIPTPRMVRDAVLALRRKKSMVIDPSDPYSRSVGSFFMNPVFSRDEFTRLEQRWREHGDGSAIPTFEAPAGIKIPAAWLVERAGFRRGTRRGSVGISANHALALVNFGGTTSELLAFADDISREVFRTFSIELQREPVVVPPDSASAVGKRS